MNIQKIALLAWYRSRFARTRASLTGRLTPIRPAIYLQPGVVYDVSPQLPEFSSPSRKSRIGSLLSALALSLALIVGIVLFLPQVYFWLSPVETVPVVATEPASPLGGSYNEGTASKIAAPAYLPPVDESLPKGNWVVIPRIGVRTELLKTAEAGEALAQGVWWVPDFGQPGDEEKPMILVAHRFGYKWWWQSEYWKYHSFYLLPELEPGDTVEIIADQRKWTYEIYAGEEGSEISDYQADLILYTCKYLQSSVRHFRYARLINPQVNTQQTY